ncbi:MAG: rhomboid family intramembrane serine protease [Woeseiaceae bacterium]|nr:rhomboid family intramembrane serine protease [Woeseiaceae bacterium]
MTDDWRVVFDSRNRIACSDRALVLAAAEIPHELIVDGSGFALIVPAEFSAAAARELRLYDDENPPAVCRAPRRVPQRDPVPGIIGYLFVVCLVAWLAGISAFGENWLAAGRVDGALIRDGDWWRLVTALTLHSGLPHLAGNIVFGTLFGLFAGRLLGSGIAWFAIVVTAAAGNLLNTLLLESAHRSIGASTAVFAALGLVAGFVWRARLMSQERWPYRVGPIVGGVALLMYTGTGDANTDVGAHLMGFVCGFLGGVVLVRFFDALDSGALQWGCGVAALALLCAAWLASLASPAAPIM